VDSAEYWLHISLQKWVASGRM